MSIFQIPEDFNAQLLKHRGIGIADLHKAFMDGDCLHYALHPCHDLFYGQWIIAWSVEKSGRLKKQKCALVAPFINNGSTFDAQTIYFSPALSKRLFGTKLSLSGRKGVLLNDREKEEFPALERALASPDFKCVIPDNLQSMRDKLTRHVVAYDA